MLQFAVLGSKVLVWIIVVCLENVSNKLYNPEWERHIAKCTTKVRRLWENGSSFPKAYQNKTLPGVSLWTEAHSRSGVLNTFSASALLPAKGTLRSEWDAKHVSAPQVAVSRLGLGNRHNDTPADPESIGCFINNALSVNPVVYQTCHSMISVHACDL